MNITYDQKITKVFNRGIARTLNHLRFLSFENQEIYKITLWELKDDILECRCPKDSCMIKFFREYIYRILEILDYLPLVEKQKIKKGLWLLKDDVFIALGYQNG